MTWNTTTTATTNTNTTTATTTSAATHGKVIVLEGDNPYINLAYESYLAAQERPANEHTLLLWQSRPTVVIGLSQNPWIEADLQEMRRRNVWLARRRSGGGTVYHDAGNLNLSFISPRASHAPEDNAAMVAQALAQAYNLNVDVTPKLYDLRVDGAKISGSAERLIRTAAYHHCTLLIDSDPHAVLSCLHSPPDPLVACKRGMTSRRSPVTTLRSLVSPFAEEAEVEKSDTTDGVSGRKKEKGEEEGEVGNQRAQLAMPLPPTVDDVKRLLAAAFLARHPPASGTAGTGGQREETDVADAADAEKEEEEEEEEDRRLTRITASQLEAWAQDNESRKDEIAAMCTRDWLYDRTPRFAYGPVEMRVEAASDLKGGDGDVDIGAPLIVHFELSEVHRGKVIAGAIQVVSSVSKPSSAGSAASSFSFSTSQRELDLAGARLSEIQALCEPLLRRVPGASEWMGQLSLFDVPLP